MVTRGRRTQGMEAIRVERLRMAVAGTRAEVILDTADTALRVTVGRAACLVMAVDAPQVAVGIIPRRVVVDTTPVAGAGAPTAEAEAEEVTPEVADVRVVAAAAAAAVTPVAEDMAAAIAKKLGDGMSLREAAT